MIGRLGHERAHKQASNGKQFICRELVDRRI